MSAGDLRHLIPERERRNTDTFQGLWHGKFAVAPVLIADKAYVILPEIDKKSTWGPCKWSPRVQATSINVAEAAQSAHVGGIAEAAHLVSVATLLFPLVGDVCLVAFDNLRFPWVVAWWPFGDDEK